MVCRSTRIGSAITSYARLSSGLIDVQALSTYHELLREGRHANAPTPEQINYLVDSQQASVRSDQNLTEARRRSILTRLDEARTQNMDGRTFYASTRLMDRTATAHAALSDHYDRVARDLGISRAQVESAVAAHITAADNNGRTTSAPTGWAEGFASRPENTGIPLDRQTAYALHQMEERRDAARAETRTRPTVTSRREFPNSTAVRSVGYDRDSGRVEVEMRSRPGQYYAYRMSETQHAEFVNAPSVGSYYARRIRSNPDFQYANAAEHAAAGTQTQCGTCGQFAGPGHSCPVRDSAEERAQTTRRAAEAAAARRVRPRNVAIGYDFEAQDAEARGRSRFAAAAANSGALQAVDENERAEAENVADQTTSGAQAEAAGSGAPGDDLRAEAHTRARDAAAFLQERDARIAAAHQRQATSADGRYPRRLITGNSWAVQRVEVAARQARRDLIAAQNDTTNPEAQAVAAAAMANLRDDLRAEAAANPSAGAQAQCETCGQFAGPDHSCPTRDSLTESEQNNMRSLLVQAETLQEGWRASLAEAMANSGALRAVDESARAEAQDPVTPDTDAAELRRRLAGSPGDDLRAEAAANLAAGTTTGFGVTRLNSDTGCRRYTGDIGQFRMISLSQVRAQASNNSGGAVSVPVYAHMDQDAGGAPIGRGFVSGRVMVNRRNGHYNVVAVNEPGDSGDDQLRCNCSAYRACYDCEHVRATVASIEARINQTHLRTPHQVAQATAEVGGVLAAERAESLTEQATSQATWGEPEVSYSDDEAAFKADYKAAKDRIAAGEQAVPYMTVNATDGLGARGTGRAFGVELEFQINPGVNRANALAAIGRDMRAAGLTRDASQVGYHSAARRGYTENHQGGWSYEADCTVDGEIVSPIMYDTPETWENLQKVTDIIKRHGGVATVSAGSHVHVSAHNYDHTVGNHNRLMGIVRENEDVVFRLSTNPERGTHRGSRWCRPNNTPATGYRNVSQAQHSGGHGTAVNLSAVSGNTNDHVEFRTWDGTLEPSVIQTQIKMSLAMTEAAFRDTDHNPTAALPLGSRRTANRAEHGATRRLTGEAWSADTAGFRSFADRLFRRASDKAQLASLFAATKWQRG